jgi:hypothetical protein
MFGELPRVSKVGQLFLELAYPLVLALHYFLDSWLGFLFQLTANAFQVATRGLAQIRQHR